MHARLRDVTTAESARAAASAAAAAAAGEYNKGVSSADLPRLLVSLLRTLHANATTKTAGDEVTMLYVASNRPATVREVLPAIAEGNRSCDRTLQRLYTEFSDTLQVLETGR